MKINLNCIPVEKNKPKPNLDSRQISLNFRMKRNNKSILNLGPIFITQSELRQTRNDRTEKEGERENAFTKIFISVEKLHSYRPFLI